MRSLWLDTQPVEAPDHAPRLQPGTRYGAVIAGAGLTGLTTAVLLARSGLRVAVLEARSVGAVASGNTTAKVSVLQGANLSTIRQQHSDELLQAYVEANREGQAWLLRYLDDHGLNYQRRAAASYAHQQQSLPLLEQELDAAQATGLEAEWSAETELPYPVAGAVVLHDQAQIHPMQVLDALAAELRDRGGVIFEGVRMTGAEVTNAVSVETTAGVVHADHLVVATGSPVLDRGGYFAKMTGQRSYAAAYRLPEATPLPQGMYLSVDAPHRSTRTAVLDEEELLLVGGNGHMVGRAASHRDAVEDLHAWTREHFPGAERTHTWAAQDYQPAGGLPYVGTLPRGGGRIYVATGYNKWGMTNGVAAALALSSEILEGQMPWAETLYARRPSASGVLTGVKENADIGARMLSDWTSKQLQTLPDEVPAEGQGVVGRREGAPVGVSTVDGTTRAVSAVCPHMGGVLSWNDAECSWDCPLHASRFAADGTRLEGPTVKDLSPAE